MGQKFVVSARCVSREIDVPVTLCGTKLLFEESRNLGFLLSFFFIRW